MFNLRINKIGSEKFLFEKDRSSFGIDETNFSSHAEKVSYKHNRFICLNMCISKRKDCYMILFENKTCKLYNQSVCQSLKKSNKTELYFKKIDQYFNDSIFCGENLF